MANSLESLEEKFRQVERANERRVLDEPGLSQMELVHPLTEPRPRRYHKRPGVSVSQFGKQEGRGVDGLHSLAPSPLFAAASKSTFYHALAHPRSVDSFVSENFSEGTRDTEEQHEIQVQRIVGRQTLPGTVGALLPRQLTRAQSQLDYVSINTSTVVDVSVETATESSHPSPSLQTSTAYATRPSRPRAATVDFVTPHGNLVERAKDFARKLRRKSRAE